MKKGSKGIGKKLDKPVVDHGLRDRQKVQHDGQKNHSAAHGEDAGKCACQKNGDDQ